MGFHLVGRIHVALFQSGEFVGSVRNRVASFLSSASGNSHKAFDRYPQRSGIALDLVPAVLLTRLCVLASPLTLLSLSEWAALTSSL